MELLLFVISVFFCLFSVKICSKLKENMEKHFRIRLYKTLNLFVAFNWTIPFQLYLSPVVIIYDVTVSTEIIIYFKLIAIKNKYLCKIHWLINYMMIWYVKNCFSLIEFNAKDKTTAAYSHPIFKFKQPSLYIWLQLYYISASDHPQTSINV